MVGDDANPAALPVTGPVGRLAPFADFGLQGCGPGPGGIGAAVNAFQQTIPDQACDGHADRCGFDVKDCARAREISQ